jgi:hypothetical protein
MHLMAEVSTRNLFFGLFGADRGRPGRLARVALIGAGGGDERVRMVPDVERDLTNAFSKKIENHAHVVALHFMHYNFARPHQSLGKRVTPAMVAGIERHPWSLTDRRAAGLSSRTLPRCCN